MITVIIIFLGGIILFEVVEICTTCINAYKCYVLILFTTLLFFSTYVPVMFEISSTTYKPISSYELICNTDTGNYYELIDNYVIYDYVDLYYNDTIEDHKVLRDRVYLYSDDSLSLFSSYGNYGNVFDNDYDKNNRYVDAEVICYMKMYDNWL